MKGFITQEEQLKLQTQCQTEENLSIMEKFPEYQFRPTTLTQPKFRLKLFILFSIIECIALFFLASLVFFICIEILRIEPEYVIVVPWIIWLGGSFIAIRNTKKKYKKVDLI